MRARAVVKAILNFFGDVRECARSGGREYFLHNFGCRYDWVWATRYCLIRDGRWRDILPAIFSPAYAKNLRKQAIEKSARRNQEFVAVYNEHNDHTFADGLQHFLGRHGCGGAEAGCTFCVDEWAAHSSGQCDDECPMCEWISKGYVYIDGRWTKLASSAAGE